MNPLARAVLELLLEHHPAVDEVVRHIAPDPADIADRDEVLAAIMDLTQAGIAHRLHEFVFASATAVLFERLANV